ncbi:MAG: GNAT family N-acetyltransferase, partial [Pseudomonadota bacterium]
PFKASDLNNFSALHVDPDVMEDLGGPINRAASKAKLDRYIATHRAKGYGRMAVFNGTDFAGYVGVQQLPDATHPLGPHDEIGWRIARRFWGRGIATRAATLCLDDAFHRAGLPHVLSYTASDNQRSQDVMTRLGLTRTPSLDFEEDYPPIGPWQGLVWRITAEDWAQRAGGIE